MNHSKKNHSVDMLHGPLFGKLIAFALPVAASSILQQLFNSADTAVVGHFASSKALAAVGSNTEVIALFLTFFTGLSVGANVLIASLIGRGQRQHINRAVHTVILMALCCGLFLLALGQLLAGPVLTAMHTPEDVLGLAVLYLRLYFLGAPFICLYNFGSAVLRAKGDSQRPLYALICAGVINVLLNLVFVILLHMSVEGVALATVISNILSSGAVMYFLMTEEEDFRLSPGKLCLDGTFVKRVFAVGAPAGISSAVFAFANVFIQSAINGFGSAAVAGAAAALNFEYFAYYVHGAFSQATTTFVSQNYAAGQFPRCREIVRKCTLTSMISCALFIALMVSLRMPLVRLFSDDEVVISYAITRIMTALILEWLPAAYEIPAAGLRGMGHSSLPALEIIVGTCMFRLLWLAFVFKGTGSFRKLLLVYPFSWILTGVIVLISYMIIVRKEERRMPSAQAGE